MTERTTGYEAEMQTDGNDKNDATAVVKILNDDYGIQLGELKKLIGTKEKRKPQLRIEFNDLSYSVYHSKGTCIFIVSIVCCNIIMEVINNITS